MNSVIEVKPIDTKEIENSRKQVAEFKAFTSLIVKDQSTYETAILRIKTVETFGNQLNERRLKITRLIDSSKKAVMELFRDPVEQCEAVATDLRTKVNKYHYDMEQARFEEQRKAQQKARAEEDRLRKIKEEQERVLREKEEAKRKEAEKLAKAGKAEEARKAMAEAEKASEKADQRAQEAMNVSVAPVIVDQKVEQPKGVGTTKKWKFEIIDEKLVPSAFRKVDEDKLQKYATSMQGSAEVPGVRFFYETVTSIRK